MRYRDTDEPSPEVLFRYRLVSEVVSRVLRGEDRADSVRAVVAHKQHDLSGNLRHVSERTLYRWLARYIEYGFTGLVPARRKRVESRARV